MLLERAVLGERQRGVERGLPAHRRQQRVGPLLLDDLGDDFGRDRLDIGRVGQLGIGHDRRRVRIDDDDAIALGLQRLDRLAPGIIELRRLADDDRPGADDEDGGDVGARGIIVPSRVDGVDDDELEGDACAPIGRRRRAAIGSALRGTGSAASSLHRSWIEVAGGQAAAPGRDGRELLLGYAGAAWRRPDRPTMAAASTAAR